MGRAERSVFLSGLIMILKILSRIRIINSWNTELHRVSYEASLDVISDRF